MISNKELEHELAALSEVAFVEVTGDGHHYNIILVSDVFTGLSTLARQKWVYAKLHDYIRSGVLHAVQMKTCTTSEWEKQRG